MKTLIAFVVAIFLVPSSYGELPNSCTQSPEQTKRMLDRLIARALCATSANIASCAKLIGGKSIGAAVAGPIAVAALFASRPVGKMLLDDDDVAANEQASSPKLFDTSKRYVVDGSYTTDRDALHQKIVNSILSQVEGSAAHPRLVLTAGAPGAGKSTVIQALKDAGLLSDKEFILIAADEIQTHFPEYKSFVQLDAKSAAGLVHMEATDVQVLALREAIRLHKNIILDGTLTHTDFFQNLLTELHAKYPNYSTSIVSVDAETKTLLQRVRERGIETGRYVSEDAVLLKKNELEHSLKTLAPLVDSVIRVDNQVRPTVTSILTKDGLKNFNLIIEAQGPSEQLAALRISLGVVAKNEERVPISVAADGLRGLFGAALERLSLGSEASLALARMATGPIVQAGAIFASMINQTACDEHINKYADHKGEQCNHLMLRYSPKTLAFLALPEERQLEALSSVPDLCAYIEHLYAEQIENSPISKVSCNEDGSGYTANDGMFKVSVDPKRGFTIESQDFLGATAFRVYSLTFGADGFPNRVCLFDPTAKAEAERAHFCPGYYNIRDVSSRSYDQTGRLGRSLMSKEPVFTSRTGLFSATNETLSLVSESTVNEITDYNFHIVEALSCCSFSRISDRCKAILAPAPSSQPKSGTKDGTHIECVDSGICHGSAAHSPNCTAITVQFGECARSGS